MNIRFSRMFASYLQTAYFHRLPLRASVYDEYRLLKSATDAKSEGSAFCSSLNLESSLTLIVRPSPRKAFRRQSCIYRSLSGLRKETTSFVGVLCFQVRRLTRSRFPPNPAERHCCHCTRCCC